MSECLVNTLGECVDKYLMRRFNDSRKNYEVYLSIAEDVWRELFMKTLWIVQNKWVGIEGGTPYNYINIPKDCLRFLSCNIDNGFGNLIPIYQNSKLDVIAKPVNIRSCGCNKCDCGGLCYDVNNLVVTTKPVIIGGTTYYEKIWYKYCSNGDILEYRELPVIKYNSMQVAGDYNHDYNNDYNIGYGFDNYTVEVNKSEKIICKLETKPCGCPTDTQNNIDTVLNCCGAFLPCNSCIRPSFSPFVKNTSTNCKTPTISFSECGTKIFVKDIDLSKNKWILIKYQTDGVNIDEEVQVPLYARKALWNGIDAHSKEFNDRYNWNEKEMARIGYEREITEVVKFMNPLSLEFLETVQDTVNRW